MSKIKILAIPSDSHGVGKFRILDPYKYIGDNYINDIHVDISFNVPNTNESFNGYNIVVFHSFIHQTSQEDNVNRIKWLKTQGIKTIMDIDDFWSPDQRHPMYQQIVASRIAERKLEMLRLVDYISTTTPIFAKTIQNKLNTKNCATD